jgi:hypothetical protein
MLVRSNSQPVNYPYAIEGTQVHINGALKDMRTNYRVRFVSIESAQTWMRGVMHNERAGLLNTRKLSAYLIENGSSKVVQTLMTDLDSYEF